MVKSKGGFAWGLMSFETTDDSKELEIAAKAEEQKAAIRKLELQNEKDIAAKHEETLLKIEETRLKSKEIIQEKDTAKKKEKEEEIKKDWGEIKRLIEENNKKIVDGVGEKTSKLEDQQTQAAADAKNARDKGDKRAEQLALKTLAEVNKKLSGIKTVGANLLSSKDIDLLAQETAKPWFQKIDWKVPKNWILIVLLLGLLYLIYRMVMWSIGKVKRFFSSDN